MDHAYEIFKKLPSKQAAHGETATDLVDAKNRWRELTHMFPAEYFIVDYQNSVFIVPFGNTE
jgi:hypothetical protein